MWSRDSSVGIATCYGLEGPGIESRWSEIFRTYPDLLRGPPSLLYNGYRVFPRGKGGRGVILTSPPPPSSAEVKKELSYTFTHPVGPPGPVTGFPLPLFISCNLNSVSSRWNSRCLKPCVFRPCQTKCPNLSLNHDKSMWKGSDDTRICLVFDFFCLPFHLRNSFSLSLLAVCIYSQCNRFYYIFSPIINFNKNGATWTSVVLRLRVALRLPFLSCISAGAALVIRTLYSSP
jgi:hypothetical protein